MTAAPAHRRAGTLLTTAGCVRSPSAAVAADDVAPAPAVPSPGVLSVALDGGTIHVDGCLDRRSVELLLLAIDWLSGTGIDTITVSLAHAYRVDTAAARALSNRRRELADAGSTLTVVVPAEPEHPPEDTSGIDGRT